jgi:hypothetical protein
MFPDFCICRWLWLWLLLVVCFTDIWPLFGALRRVPRAAVLLENGTGLAATRVAVLPVAVGGQLGGVLPGVVVDQVEPNVTSVN